MDPLASPIIFVQINDVYFIDARADYSKQDGFLLPRVATVVKRLRKRFYNQVFFVLPGDFLAPSCLSRLFRGRQMISVLNSMGLDYATFGNHEFEAIFTPEILAKLVRKSKFKWLSANLHTDDEQLWRSFEGFANPTLSRTLKLFLTGILYQDDYKGFGRTLDPASSAIDLIDIYEEALREETTGKGKMPDTFYAVLTHQRCAEDIRFANAVPKFRLLMGGHDHNVFYAVDERKTLIVKAMSNARSIRLNCVVTFEKRDLPELIRSGGSLQILERVTYAVRDEIMSHVYFGSTLSKEEVKLLPKWQKDFLQSERHTNTNIEYLEPYGEHYVGFFSIALRTTDDEFLNLVPEDRAVMRRIRRWTRLWQRTSGENDEPILKSPIALNAEDRCVRSHSTNIGNLLADVVRHVGVSDGVAAEIGFLNSGALRIDRVLPKGESLSERTICDLLFHPNKLRIYRNVPGSRVRLLLQKCAELRAAAGDDGDGNFLQVSGIRVFAEGASVTKIELVAPDVVRPLDEGALYLVACNDYVGGLCRHYEEAFTGLEYNEFRPLRESLKIAFQRWSSPENSAELAQMIQDFNQERWIFTDTQRSTHLCEA